MITHENNGESVTLELKVIRGRKGGYTAFVNGSPVPEYSVSNLWEHTLQVCALHSEMFKENAFPPASFFQTTQPQLAAPVHHQQQPPRPQPPAIPNVAMPLPREEEEVDHIPPGIRPDGNVLGDLQRRLGEISANGRVTSALLVLGFTVSLIARGAVGA
jgi:hypothetical protein